MSSEYSFIDLSRKKTNGEFVIVNRFTFSTENDPENATLNSIL